MEAGISLVVQWLRICLPMQGTRVRDLVREDLTGHGATKPVRHNYWACALEPVSHNYWAHMPQLLKPACLQPMLHNKRSHRNEKPPLAATRESSHTATKTQRSQKKRGSKRDNHREWEDSKRCPKMTWPFLMYLMVSFYTSFIHSFNKYLLSSYCTLSVVPGATWMPLPLHITIWFVFINDHVTCLW